MMKKMLMLASALTVIASVAAPLSITSANADVRHGGGGRSGGFHGGGFHGGGHYAGNRGRVYGGGYGGGYHRGYYGNGYGYGYGGYGGWNGGYYGCGPIQLTLGLCGPYGL